MKTKFEYFHNHGDEGNNSLTIIFGEAHDSNHTIVGCENTETDAVEAVKRLNGILDQHAAQCVEEFKGKLQENLVLMKILNPASDIGVSHNATIDSIIKLHL